MPWGQGRSLLKKRTSMRYSLTLVLLLLPCFQPELVQLYGRKPNGYGPPKRPNAAAGHAGLLDQSMYWPRRSMVRIACSRV